MTTVKGVNIAKLDGQPAMLPEVNAWHGRMRVQYDEYRCDNLKHATSIVIGRLPKGARIYDVVVHHEALGSDITMAVRTDDTVLVTPQDVSSAGTIVQSIDGHIAGFGLVTKETTDVVLVVFDGLATGLVKSAIFYAVD